jgi:hypothetical protein
VAGVYAPTITSFALPFLTIRSQDDTRYDEIQQSLSTTTYLAQNVEITASSTDQISQPVVFENYDVNGDLSNFTLNPLVDPYQFQRALEVKLSDQNVIFDGKTKMNVQVLPNNSATLDFNVTQVSASGVDDLGDSLDDEALAKIYDSTIFQGIEKFQENVEEIFDYDFMNRSGFFPDLNTSLRDLPPLKINELFTDFTEEL